jgi:hypothetical protein
VPFSPFSSDVQVGKLKSIASMCNTVGSTFISDLRYSADKHNGTPTRLFSIRLPTFVNHLESPIARNS